jgi:hypothetical protein
MGVDVYIHVFLTLVLIVSGQLHALAALSPGKEPQVPIVEAGWAPEPVWMTQRRENS